MARRTPSFLEAATQSFRERVSCSICWDVYKTPRALRCLHTFCEECIQGTINTLNATRRQKNIICPECRQKTPPPKNQPPEEWAKHLPKNFVLENLLEKLQEPRNIADTAGDEVDGQRSVDPADLEECRKIELCQWHPDSKLEFYCPSHEALLCLKCCESSHNWGCPLEAIQSLATDYELSCTAVSLREDMEEIDKKLEDTAVAMKDDLRKAEKSVDGFPQRLMELRHEIDLLMNEMQIELSKAESKEETVTKYTQDHHIKIAECESRQEALRSIQRDMDVAEKYGTLVQRFIAAHQLSRHVRMFQRAADDSATSAMRVELQHDGIEVLASILKMKPEMRIVQARHVNLVDRAEDTN